MTDLTAVSMIRTILKDARLSEDEKLAQIASVIRRWESFYLQLTSRVEAAQ